MAWLMHLHLYFPLGLLFYLLFMVCYVGGIGANWGSQATHLLPRATVVNFLRNNGIQKVKKLFDASMSPRALGWSGIDVMVGIPNDMLSTLAGNSKAVEKWVSRNVSTHINNNNVNIKVQPGFMSHISAGKGTPMTPGPVDAYLFSIDEDAKSITPRNFGLHGDLYLNGTPKYSFNLGTTNSGALVPTQGVQYLPHQWRIFKPSAKLDDPQVVPSMSYACANGDCTSLGHGTSCDSVNVDGNISYAFNCYYQINNQLDNTCKLSGLGVMTKEDPSARTCKFNTMIQTYYTDTMQ